MKSLSDSDGRSPVEILAEEYLQRQARGESVTVEQYAEEHPDLAEDIRDIFPAFEAMKTLSTEWKNTVVKPHRSGFDLPANLGDYLLQRVIGRGGMGTVYEAEHTSLRRQVAVKTLHRVDSDEGIKRFRHEAQAAAQLHHTNIVPVFDFGESQGQHYIAMQLIQGHGLDAVVEQLRDENEGFHSAATDESSQDESSDNARPAAKLAAKLAAYQTHQYWKDVADIGIQAARGLAYAHEQGTMHRDVKPANLLRDVSGTVWVADFGLARSEDADLSRETQTLSGTLRYLSPEQLQGACDARTDQYGLGLSLYELATLQPVVDKASSHAEIIRKVSEARIVPPRRINSEIPRDLETIILKAIAQDPRDRFPTCRHLADDLQRFLDGEPTLSRPVRAYERLWRWAKRYPALATASATSAVLLVLIAVLTSFSYRTESQLRQRAEENSLIAQQALDSVFDRFAAVGDPFGPLNGSAGGSPMLSQQSGQMLQGLLPVFDRLAELDNQSPELRQRAAKARKRVGDIQQQLGQFDEAIQSYQQAAARYRELPLTDHDLSLTLADIYNDIGVCSLMLGQVGRSRSSHRMALDLLEANSESTPETKFQLAQTRFFLGRRLRPGESPNDRSAPPEHASDRRQHFETAVTLLESVSESDRQPRHLHLLAKCLKGLSSDHFSDRSAEEQRREERAIDILEQLTAEAPNVPEYRHALVSALASVNTRDPRAIALRDLAAAEQQLKQAAAHGAQLVAAHPYVTQYTQTLIHTYNRLGHIQERRAHHAGRNQSVKHLRAALNAYESAARLQRMLIERFPDSQSYRGWLENFDESTSFIRQQIEEQESQSS